jgi:hypothetical protein
MSLVDLNVALICGQRHTAVVGDFHTLAYEHESTQTNVYQEFQEQFEARGLMNNVAPELLRCDCGSFSNTERLVYNYLWRVVQLNQA